jgi:MFS family permease
VPQIIVAVMAPLVGRQAQGWGRRPLLLIGFAALPIRALGFALISDPSLLLAVQALDGISATPLGVLTALIIADLTGGTGRFNLAQGIVGTASGIGASISTTLSGLVAESLGSSVAFLCIAATASLGTLMIWFLMPETKPPTEHTETDGQSVGHAYESLWLDNITRSLVDGGTLQRYIDEFSVTGRTSNGDQPNDVLMFKRFGFSIAMGNASGQVKAQVAAVTDSYNDEGFAKAMESFILGSAR